MPGGLCEAIPAPTRDSGFSPSACVVTAGAWIMVTHKNLPPTPLYVFYVCPRMEALCVRASLPL